MTLEIFRHRGFTLLELLLVLVVLVVVAAAVVPNFSRTARALELRAAAEDMAYTLRYGQLRAVTKGRPVQLNMDKRSYWLEEDPSVQSADIAETNHPHFKRVKNRWGRGIEIPSGIEWTPADSPIALSPDGRMSTANVRLCRAQDCLVVSTAEERGQVNIFDEKETNDADALL